MNTYSVSVPDNGALPAAVAALRQRIETIDAQIDARPLYAPFSMLDERHAAECAIDCLEAALRRHEAARSDEAASARRAADAAERRREYALMCAACFCSGAIGFFVAVYFFT